MRSRSGSLRLLVAAAALCLGIASDARAQNSTLGADIARTVATACFEYLTAQGEGLSRLTAMGLRRSGSNFTGRTTLEGSRADLFIVTGSETCRYTITTYSERRPGQVNTAEFASYLRAVERLASSHVAESDYYIFVGNGRRVRVHASETVETRGSRRRYSTTFMARLWR